MIPKVQIKCFFRRVVTFLLKSPQSHACQASGETSGERYTFIRGFQFAGWSTFLDTHPGNNAGHRLGPVREAAMRDGVLPLHHHDGGGPDEEDGGDRDGDDDVDGSSFNRL